jgi:hypothetical protein
MLPFHYGKALPVRGLDATARVAGAWDVATQP